MMGETKDKAVVADVLLGLSLVCPRLLYLFIDLC